MTSACPKNAGGHWWKRITGAVTAVANWYCVWCGAAYLPSDDESCR